MESNKQTEKGYQDIQKYVIERCLQGDQRAQYELYKLYAGAMFNVCRRMMGKEEEARDVLQDAFVIAFQKLHTFRHESTFGAWLKRIVINKCISTLQQKKILTSSLDEKYDTIDQADDRDEDALQYEVKKVMNAIDQISDGCKVVLNLYLFEGYDHQEIADILGITESTSKAQYSKARKKIREILGKTKK